jgi:hypothetical protein
MCVEPSAMRYDGHDEIDRDREESEEIAPPVPLDAAESAWDPWLWALYLRELAEKRPPTLH